MLIMTYYRSHKSGKRRRKEGRKEEAGREREKGEGERDGKERK